MDLVEQIYRASDCFPQQERYALIDQLRRAATSIPANIAEGAARNTKKEFVNYLHIAQGSLSELDTLLEISRRLDYLSPDAWASLDADLTRIDKMLSGLIRSQKTPNVSRLTPYEGRRSRNP
jgi:four helix bundle protein